MPGDPQEAASAERQTDPGRKFDHQKLRYDLVPVEPLRALVEVYTYGAAKYEDRNWEKGITWSRIYAAVMRHLQAMWGGEDIDTESGLPHLAHAAWGLFALLDYRTNHPEMDDRPLRYLEIEVK